MPDIDNPNVQPAPPMTDTLKSWMMVILTLLFVLLYAGVLVGWIALSDDAKDLQPIIFVIIGYYFGRLPSQQNENSLKGEINRQATKADAATIAKEKSQQEREVLEEKLKNARAVLTSGDVESSLTVNESREKGFTKNYPASGSIETAVRILNS